MRLDLELERLEITHVIEAMHCKEFHYVSVIMQESGLELLLHVH